MKTQKPAWRAKPIIGTGAGLLIVDIGAGLLDGFTTLGLSVSLSGAEVVASSITGIGAIGSGSAKILDQ